MYRREALRAGLGVATAGFLGRVTTATDQAQFAPLGRVNVDGAKEVVVRDDGQVAYAAISDGYATFDVTDPTEPRVLAERRGVLEDRENGPLRQVYDVKEDGDRLLVVGPAHGGHDLYAAVVVDVSDPADPRRVAVFETDSAIHNCDLADGYAYLTDFDGDRNPLVIVDVRDDDPVEVSRWSIVDADGAWGAVSPALRSLHDVRVRGDVACLAQWDAGTWLVDVADPTEPSVLGSVTEYSPDDLADLGSQAARRESRVPPGNDHYATLDETGTLLAIGKESWAVEIDGSVVGGPSGVTLWDVSTPEEPAHLSTIEPPSTADPTRSGIWTTAHNLDVRGGVLYTAWYDGGVTRHDVSDPTAPIRTAWWREPDTTRFWTAQAAVPGEFFVASDMGAGTETGRGGPGAELFTFPDRPGEQASPAELAWTASGASGGAGAVTTGPVGGETDGQRSAAATEASSPTASTRTGASGFGVGGLLAALAGTAWWVRRRERP